MVWVLERLAFKRGLPKILISDNGSEFTGKTLDAWANRFGIKLHFIDSGRPMQNAYVESFNGKFRPAQLIEQGITEKWEVPDPSGYQRGGDTWPLPG